MADFVITDKTLLTSVDRAADSFLVYDNSATALKRTTVNSLLDLTSHPVGIDDVQTLTNKTLTAPTASSPVLSGTVTGTYTIAGTPTFPSTVVTTTGTQTLTNKTLTSPAINTATIANPTLTVDTVSEFTSTNGVTIDGVLLKDSNMNGSYITDATITTAKILDGNVTSEKLSSTIAFKVYMGTAQTMASGYDLAEFNTEVYDKGSDYNTTTFKFIAPIAGLYNFSWRLDFKAMGGQDYSSALYLNGSLASLGEWFKSPVAGADPATGANTGGSVDMLLAANDEIQMYSYLSTVARDMEANVTLCWFAGRFVGTA